MPMCERSMPRSRACCHDLHVHQLLMIGAVIVHDVQQRNLVMRRGPQDAGSVVQIAVALDVHAQASVLLVRQRCADGGRRAVADAVCAVRADEVVMLR